MFAKMDQLIDEKLTGSSSNINQNVLDLEEAQTLYLREIDKTLKVIATQRSQSVARDTVFGRASTGTPTDRDRVFNVKSASKKTPANFFDAFEEQFLEGLLGYDVKSKVKDILSQFETQFETPLKDVPGKLGQELGKLAISQFTSTKFGKAFSDRASKILESGVSKVVSWAGIDLNFKPSSEESTASTEPQSNRQVDVAGVASDAAENLGQVFSNVGGDVQKSSGSFVKSLLSSGDAATTSGASLLKFGKFAGIAGAAMVAVQIILEKAGPVIQSATEFFKGLGIAATREKKSREQNQKYAQERLVKDVEAMIEAPFNILKAAANEFYQVWDNNLRLITGTQGYTKADVQDLMSAFAQRLRDEGLTNVISVTDITENLSSILKSGLSGKVAEEFAYQSMLLNSAIPTQDFLGFAETYSSIAANAIKNGKGQQAALEIANRSLRSFANNVLYASRELAGGFSTGLKDAQALYEQSAKIVQISGQGDIEKVSGVLTSVAAIVGAVAPDLATSITDAIYKAATGGNSEDIVALRSLAGVNASNTEFLKALSTDPQKIFSTLFNNLAQMYSQYGDAFMERAEGFANIFGLSPEAFQRIDFNYLATAISNMNTSSMSLDKNLEMLQSGQTTQTAEQMKAAQINQYALEEGLSYVLDNNVARSIQEHMWDEQIARELMEAHYGVDLQGKSFDLLNKITQFVSDILDFLNPFAWLKKLGNLIQTTNEASALSADIHNLLVAGKVGQPDANADVLRNLTTRNQDLKLVTSIVDMFGGTSAYQQARRGNVLNRVFGLGTTDSLLGLQGSASQRLLSDISSMTDSLRSSVADFQASSPTSSYNWATVGKSESNFLRDLANTMKSTIASQQNAGYSKVTEASPMSSDTKILQNMLSQEYMNKFIEENKSYEEWKASGKFKDADSFSKAVEAAGYQESDIENYFQSMETQRGLEEEHQRRERERIFQEAGTNFWTVDYPEKYYTPLMQWLENPLMSWFRDTWTPWMQDTVFVYAQGAVEDFRSRWDDLINRWETTKELFTSWWEATKEYHSKVTDWQDSFRKYFENTYAKNWEKHWTDYSDRYLKYKVYYYTDKDSGELTRGRLGLSKLRDVKAAENAKGSGDVVNALSKYLTRNSEAVEDLRDPQVQTNAILAQILIVVNAIMNQTNAIAVPELGEDTLTALAKGAISAVTSSKKSKK